MGQRIVTLNNEENVAPEFVPFLSTIELAYNSLRFSNYDQFMAQIMGYPFSEESKEELLRRFPEPVPVNPPHWDVSDEEEEHTEAYLRNPPDPGPLSQYQNHGWIDDATADTLREHQQFKEVQGRMTIRDPSVLEDIRENTLHILGRCNNPTDWGENSQGLVYGMVQSGKTASMVNLISMGMLSGYKLFIILAGDKTSLRNQTQDRINTAFDLVNGVNRATGIHSVTWKEDFGSTNNAFTGSFKTQRLIRGQPGYVNIIVIKKETHHLQNLIDQLHQLKMWCNENNFDMEKEFSAMILDDEADYASQKTRLGEPNPIHEKLVTVRETIPRNCYVAYTATPQACLSANPRDLVGYPKDFFWLLEPYAEEMNGEMVTQSYLGAWDVFWQFDDYLLNEIGRNEWPHYERDAQGRDLGIWMPNEDGTGGEHIDTQEADTNQDELQKRYLEDLRGNIRPLPPSLLQSLADYIISCGIRWHEHWIKKRTSTDMPSIQQIRQDYPHHAAMIHLSRLKEHQLISRDIVDIAWSQVMDLWDEFDIDHDDSTHLFKRCWEAQVYKTSRLKPERGHLDYKAVEPFMRFCIRITEEPIRNDRSQHYEYYEGSPYIYLVNSGDSGMRLYYDDNTPEQIKTKKAAIIVGGQILSRGLTIEGLTTSFFGRTARMPMGDTVLQMGRWFGHKKSYMDLVSIYMQEGLRTLFRQIAEADRYLRIQIKDAIFKDLRPDEILLELRNSPHFRSTSPSKSRFVSASLAGGYSGRRALLRQPIFSKETLRENYQRLQRFQRKFMTREEDAHDRFLLYRNVPLADTLSLLNDLKCNKDAIQDTYSDFARYLKDWQEADDMPPIPKINVAVKNSIGKRRRELSVSKPTSPEEARRCATGVFGPILGGKSHQNYLGDYHLDKDETWHLEHPDRKPSEPRPAGDDILLIFYRLEPNYLRNKVFDPRDTDEDHPHGKWKSEPVYLQTGDPFYVDIPPGQEDEHPALVFAAFTPLGGPKYGLGVNALLNPEKIKQRGLTALQEELIQEEG